ncbi:MAG TPA: hypothetical protein VJ775_05950 [Sphingomicrobium sp.]|nr:hypothetical protein [Sphingomicrobium sp.]
MADLLEGKTGTVKNPNSPLYGQRVVRQGGQWIPLDAPGQQLTKGSENRARVAMGLGPAVEAQKQMYASEGWNQPGAASPMGRNPFNQGWNAFAANLALSAEDKPTFFGIDKQALAKNIGGQDYQDYDQASKSWEAAILPVLSGAAITASEAQRQIRSNLPQLGDTAQTLARKAKNRAMMTNAAADLVGKPRPFPKIGTWDFGAAPSAQSRRLSGGADNDPLGIRGR